MTSSEGTHGQPARIHARFNGAIKQAARGGSESPLQTRVAVALGLELGLLALIDLDEELPHRQWYAARPSVRPVREGAEAFVGFVQSTAGRRRSHASCPGPAGADRYRPAHPADGSPPNMGVDVMTASPGVG